tara:strand:- start:786 stop:1070 length:285 start_codon:yes stop_codon:yes gene_type:complete
MIKNKTFIANVHVSSIEREEKLPLWNTHMNTFVDTHMTNNIFEVQAEDKHEVRRKVKALVNKLQTKVQFKRGFVTKQGDNATWYINRITEIKAK